MPARNRPKSSVQSRARQQMWRAKVAAAQVDQTLDTSADGIREQVGVVLKLIRRASLALDRGRYAEAALLLGNAAALTRVAATVMSAAIERHAGAQEVLDAIDQRVRLP